MMQVCEGSLRLLISISKSGKFDDTLCGTLTVSNQRVGDRNNETLRQHVLKTYDRATLNVVCQKFRFFASLFIEDTAIDQRGTDNSL